MVEETDKLEPSKELKKKKLLVFYYLKEKNIRFKLEEKTNKKDEEKENKPGIKSKKEIKKIQKIVDELILNFKKIEKTISKPKKRCAFSVLLVITLLNIRAIVKKINQYQLLDILIILENI